MNTLKGHSASVECLVVLQDGSLGSGSDDKTIRVWNISERIKLKTLTGHTGQVECLVVLPDGSLASASTDKTIKI